MATANLNRLSTEYIWNRITTAQDLAGSSVEVAFISDGGPTNYPDAEDWVTGELVQEGSQWWSRVLVGPTATSATPPGVELVPGVYGTWVRLTDTPEIPVRFTGTVAIT